MIIFPLSHFITCGSSSIIFFNCRKKGIVRTLYLACRFPLGVPSSFEAPLVVRDRYRGLKCDNSKGDGIHMTPSSPFSIFFVRKKLGNNFWFSHRNDPSVASLTFDGGPGFETRSSRPHRQVIPWVFSPVRGSSPHTGCYRHRPSVLFCFGACEQSECT